jgi:hypothetical protein
VQGCVLTLSPLNTGGNEINSFVTCKLICARNCGAKTDMADVVTSRSRDLNKDEGGVNDLNLFLNPLINVQMKYTRQLDALPQFFNMATRAVFLKFLNFANVTYAFVIF